MAQMDVAMYRRRAEEFLAVLDKEYYLHFSGQKKTCEFSAIYERYPELFTRDAVAGIKVHFEAAADEEKRRLATLLAFATEGFMSEQTKELSDELANTESKATVELDGEQVAFRYSSIMLANEPDRARREHIQKARLEVVEQVLNPRHDTIWRQSHTIAGDLGYADYLSLFTETKGIDYPMLRAQTESFLQDTESLYERVMERLVRAKLGFSLAELRHADLPYLWRAPEYDAVFSAERLIPTFRRTLAGMGIDLAAQANVIVDAEARELKSPRAFCAPVRVPDEIYLVVMPKGGQDDYGALLHEGGHTEHFAHAARDLPFEYRHLGDNAVTEGFAFIFDHLLVNPHWLETYLDYSESSDYRTFVNAMELYYLRRYAGKLTYELELHKQTGSLDAMAAVYRRCLSEATMIDVPEVNYLTDVDDGFYCASYLRAWMLEGALRMILQDRFGMEWFQDKAAVDWLAALWAHGQRYSADQLLLKSGGGRLDCDPLRHHFERAFAR